MSRLAVGSFVAALFLGLAVAPITFPLSFVAQRQIEATGRRGLALARAATIISCGYLVMGAAVVGLYLYLAGADPS